MKKVLVLAAALALAGAAAAQSKITAATANGATNATPVFTTNPGGQLVDQNGNVLTQTATGQFTDRSGALYTVDGTGRLIDAAGNVVSAPGVVINNGQSSLTGVAPSLPGINNQTISLGPQTGTTTGGGLSATPFSSAAVQSQAQAAGQSAAPNPANGAVPGGGAVLSGRVVAYQPGRTITIQQPNGLNVTFALNGSIPAPAVLAPNASVLLTTSPGAAGAPQVTRIAAAGTGSSVSTRRATASGGGTIQAASGATVTVGRGASRSSTVRRDSVYTVKSFDGSTLVVSRSDGTTRTLRVTSGSSVPSDLAPGRQIVITTRGTTSGRPVVGTVTYYPVTVTPG